MSQTPVFSYRCVFSVLDYCERYAATLSMTVLAVLAVASAPLGILCYVVKRRMTSQCEESEEKVSHRTKADWM